MIFETERLVVRNWADQDRHAFHRLNSDEDIMTYFPFRRSREEADAVMDKIVLTIGDKGVGFACVELKETNACIGICGIDTWHHPQIGFDNAVEIGWRLLPEYWGKGYVTEAAKAWLDYGFNTIGLSEIVAFAVPENTRSTAVMERIGMTRQPFRDFDHPDVPEEFSHLKQHAVYAIPRYIYGEGK